MLLPRRQNCLEQWEIGSSNYGKIGLDVNVTRAQCKLMRIVVALSNNGEPEHLA